MRNKYNWLRFICYFEVSVANLMRDFFEASSLCGDIHAGRVYLFRKGFEIILTHVLNTLK